MFFFNDIKVIFDDSLSEIEEFSLKEKEEEGVFFFLILFIVEESEKIGLDENYI